VPGPDNSLAVALNDKAGDEWLSDRALAQSRAEHLAGWDALHSHNHLEFVDLHAPLLLDILSDNPVEMDTLTLDQDNESICRASDVNWDD
jgi:hypothetical protein